VDQVRQFAPAIIAVDEHCDEERPETGHCTRLDRREHAAQYGPEVLVPPSHNAVIYSLATGGTISIISLFMAGVAPGLLLGG
jgi:hypothetical protein